MEISSVNQNFKLDYSIKDAAERVKYVENLMNNIPKDKLTSKFLDTLSDYIVFAMEKNEKKEKNILTDNRMITVNKRETSYQSLVEKFENGEDGLYNLIKENDKNVLLTPKIAITKKDIAEIDALGPLREAIEITEKAEKEATGKKKFQLKKQLIEMHQEQYLIKNSYKPPMFCANTIKSILKSDFTEHITFDENNEPISDGLITLFNPEHICALLCNYTSLKTGLQGKFSNDFYYIIEDLDNLINITLKENFPLYYDLVMYKIAGMQNVEIQKLLKEKYGFTHSIEYISSL
jgi:hypothetical protein